LFATVYLLEKFDTKPFLRIRTVNDVTNNRKLQHKIVENLRERASYALSETIAIAGDNMFLNQNFFIHWHKYCRIEARFLFPMDPTFSV
jgi:hypothetical protein